MIINVDSVFSNVELSLSNLLGCWLVRVKFKLLSHLINVVLPLIYLILDELMLLFINSDGGIISNRSVNKFVFSSLELFEGFSSNLFLSVDETILVSVVIEVDLSVMIVNLN